MRKRIEISGEDLLANYQNDEVCAWPYVFRRMVEAGARNIKITENSKEMDVELFRGLRVKTWYDRKRDTSVWEFDAADA